MSNIFIIHGAYGHPEENWFPWLKKELEKLGHKVFVPKFPTPEDQSLENWLNVFKKYEKNMDERSILIGHSIGSVFILNLLEKRESPVKAVFLVSGFTGSLGNKTFDKLNKSFTDKIFDWKKIKQNCKYFFVFHSDNDPYVPLEEAEKLAKNLNVNLILIKNAGHFNEKAGYTKFDLLLKEVKNVL